MVIEYGPCPRAEIGPVDPHRASNAAVLRVHPIKRGNISMSTSTRRLRGKKASAAVAGVVSLAIVTAACGGSGSKKTSAAGGSTDSTKAETLKLGAIFSQSGAVAAFSQGGVHAVEMAVKQINAQGGFTVGNTKYTLQLDTKDARSAPSVATA